MPSYKAPVDSVMFLLKDVLGYERYSNLAGFADAPLDTVEAVLGEAARFCEEVLQPLNQSGDREGCTRHDDASVTTPKGFREAYKGYSEAGWVGLASPSRVRRTGSSLYARRGAERVRLLRQHGVGHVSGPDRRRDRRAHPARRRRAEGALPAEADLGRVVGHDEPDRAALRHRPRADQDEGRSRQKTAATRSPARKSSSRPASTT